MTKSMNAFTSGFAIASLEGYMNSGRESGVYEPSCTVSEVGRDAAAAAVDLHLVELVRVRLVVREAEVAEAALGAGDAGHELVVVLGGLVVLARRAFLAVDLRR